MSILSRHRLGASVFLTLGVLAAGAIAASAKSDVRLAGDLSVVAVWSGAEQASFNAVLAGFEQRNPGVKVTYASAGAQLPTVLATAVQGGNPPDVAVLPQPGLMKDFVGKGALKPIDFAKSTIARNFSSDWTKLGTVNGKLYGVFFKGANKSIVWFNTSVFKQAGIAKPPKTWAGFLKIAKTLRASGTKAYSIDGADGWALTDWFENVYLRQAGAAKYDLLSTHRIKWTDPSVKAALRTLAQVFGDRGNIVGGVSGSLQTGFTTALAQLFTDPPNGAMFMEGDFVPSFVPAKAVAGRDYGFFAFPSINKSAPAVVGGGDVAVMFKDSAAARALMTYLAGPEAAEIWVRRGGFSSPNKNVPASAYPDPTTRRTAAALANARTFRFDMSDLQPGSFGATVGQGQWKLFQDFLANPKNLDRIAARLEAAATAAYKAGK
ncbi:MAG: extracellular solute-binding protein [Gaiellaceae bacterium MAG52_C11]|nr:extracellular solute-binding protein [Candidatus Gaiellasilicea maunaloa]